MIDEFPSENWRTYYAGQVVYCPGRLVGDRRRVSRDHDRRDECRRSLVRVGMGEIWRVRWLGNKEQLAAVTFSVTTHRCRDCGTVCEVNVEKIARAG